MQYLYFYSLIQWFERVPQSSCFENSVSNAKALGDESFQEMIRSWSAALMKIHVLITAVVWLSQKHTCDKSKFSSLLLACCLLSLHLCHGMTQQKVLCRMLAPWYWTSGLLNYEKQASFLINWSVEFCCSNTKWTKTTDIQPQRLKVNLQTLFSPWITI